MTTLRKLLPMALAAAVGLSAGPISFSGQFDPSLATVRTGGNGWFDPSGAPLSVTLWGNDLDLDSIVFTEVTWTITQPVSNLSFFWSYRPFEDGRFPAAAGYQRNGWFFQLTNDAQRFSQSGSVLIPSLSPGDEFGFWVTSDDETGRARFTISGVPEPAMIPEPAPWTLLGLGGLGLLVWRKLASRPRS